MKILSVAEQEIGYLEKATARQLDSKTDNAGDGNYTKYARDLYPHLQGKPWCDMFVDWCMVQAYGQKAAEDLLCGGFSAYTPASADYYKERGLWFSYPRVGDQIFFCSNGTICHTGLVAGVDKERVYTIEGNTSGASGLVANGGGVACKSYERNADIIAGYGRPPYPDANDYPAPAPDVCMDADSEASAVKWLSFELSALGYCPEVTDSYDEALTAAVAAFQWDMGLTADGVVGPDTLAALQPKGKRINPLVQKLRHLWKRVMNKLRRLLGRGGK